MMKIMLYIISMLIMSHPLSIILYILCVSIFFLLNLLLLVKSSWFSMIFMLMVLGGLMVLFIYMASLSSNEYFKFLKSYNFMFSIMITIVPVIFFSKSVSEYTMFYMMNISSLMLFFYFLFYLLLVLILIIEMLVSIKSSLRLEM
uniref:NADH dehydrogenase subunit 6 n=1 Tax=Echinolaelaps fukienensis TaxID=2902762 RepID=UPI0030DE200C